LSYQQVIHKKSPNPRTNQAFVQIFFSLCG
jgi:hypothetical protein